jgi:hypothetical protein
MIVSRTMLAGFDLLSEGPLDHPISRWIVGISVLSGAIAGIWKAWLRKFWVGSRDNVLEVVDHIKRTATAIEAVEKDLIPKDKPSLATRLDIHMKEEREALEKTSERITIIENANASRDETVMGIVDDVSQMKGDISKIKKHLGDR